MQASKGPGSSPSPRKLKVQAKGSTCPAASSTDEKAIQGFSNKVENAGGQIKFQGNCSASPTTAPKVSQPNEESTGVVTECQPADGAIAPNSVGTLSADAKSVM